MKSEVNHCKHFNAKTMTRKTSCPMLDKEWDGGDPHPSFQRFAQCMDYAHDCPDYEE